MTDATDNLDNAILDHMRANLKAHPMSVVHIRRLASLVDSRRLPCRVIEVRMKAMKTAGRYTWSRFGNRYVVDGC